MLPALNFGKVAEWSIALDLKSSDWQQSVGSNPTLSVPVKRKKITEEITEKLQVKKQPQLNHHKNLLWH